MIKKYILLIILLIIFILVNFKNKKGNEEFKTKISEKELSKLLSNLEIKFGGKNIASGLCPGHIERGINGKCEGNDKFGNRHNYQKYYSKEFLKYLDKKNNILEIGIFKGHGLAILSEIFPQSTIYGFDIQLISFNSNKDELKKKGAFKNNNIKLFKCDTTNSNYKNKIKIKKTFKKKKLDIVIDDGCHSNKCILNTFKNIFPYLKKTGVYIIEDNSKVHKELIKLYPNLNIKSYDELTIVKY